MDAFELTPTAAFYLFAAAVQVLVAALLAVRHPRREWAWTLALLFLANAGHAVVTAFGARGIASLSRYGTAFDHAGFILLAYLALTFPARPRLLRRPRGALPALFAVALAAVAAFDLLAGTGGPRNANTPLTPAALATGYALPAAVWILLLARWTWAWVRPMGETVRAQFKLVFAAVAMRAASQLVATLPVFRYNPTDPWILVAAQACNAAALLAVLACAGALVAAQSRQVGRRRAQTHFLLAFLAAGLVAGSLAINLAGLGAYYANVFNHLDLFVLRPFFVWLAFLRPAGAARLPAADRVLLWLLFLAAAFTTFAPAVTVGLPAPLQVPAAVLVAAAAATAALVLVLPRFLHRAPGDGLAPGLATYREALEEAHRNGEPGPAQAGDLERLRRRLGVAREQHDALLALGRERPAAESWGPGATALGRYRIEGLVGEGASGEAFAARDLLSGQDVVLKRTRGLDPARRRSLLREWEALARLDHPCLVRLVRTEFIGDEPVLVLERLAGSLRGRLGQGPPLTVEEAVRVAADVLSGLEALHGAGLVHGDVKPGNVLLGPGGAKLADLGAARPEATVLLGDPTLPAVPAGTVRYMAPECLEGKPSDQRADVFAVGMLLHEMLAGRHPVRATSDFAARKAIVEGAWDPLPARVPAGLRRAVGRALHLDPRRRHPTAAAFARALQAAGTGTMARPGAAAAPAGGGGPGAGCAPRGRRATAGRGRR